MTTSSFHFDPHQLQTGYTRSAYSPHPHQQQHAQAVPPTFSPLPAWTGDDRYPPSSSVLSYGHGYQQHHPSQFSSHQPSYAPLAQWGPQSSADELLAGELELSEAHQHFHPHDSPSPAATNSSSSASSASAPPSPVGERPPTPIPSGLNHNVLAPPPSYGGGMRKGRLPFPPARRAFPARGGVRAGPASSASSTSASTSSSRPDTASAIYPVDESRPSVVQTRARSSVNCATTGGRGGGGGAQPMSSESPPPPPPPARKRARAVKGRKAAAETDEEDDEDDEGVDDSEGGKLFTSHDGPGYSWGMPRAEYLALSPSAKKQLRNRVGAKIFRERRKNYLHELEDRLQEKDDRIRALEQEVAQLKSNRG